MPSTGYFAAPRQLTVPEIRRHIPIVLTRSLRYTYIPIIVITMEADMRYARIMGVTAVAILWTEFATQAADLPGCTAPAGFQDDPHPAIAPMDQLVSHTEEI